MERREFASLGNWESLELWPNNLFIFGGQSEPSPE